MKVLEWSRIKETLERSRIYKFWKDLEYSNSGMFQKVKILEWSILFRFWNGPENENSWMDHNLKFCNGPKGKNTRMVQSVKIHPSSSCLFRYSSTKQLSWSSGSLERGLAILLFLDFSHILSKYSFFKIDPDSRLTKNIKILEWSRMQNCGKVRNVKMWKWSRT